MTRNLFYWGSLKTRVTLITLAIFVTSVWALAFYASRLLREGMQRISGEQQFSTVSYIAAEVNDNLALRLSALQQYSAGRITPAVLANAAVVQTRLEDSSAIRSLFNGGVWIAGRDGIAIASVPPARIGTNFIDREYINAALKEGKSTISKPIVGKVSKAPNFVMATPVLGKEGNVIGVVVGVTELDKPSFLDRLANNRYGKTGGYALVAPSQRQIITATDKSRIMEVLPAPGVNRYVDRNMQGYEGSDVIVNARGGELLASVKRVPIAGWYVGATLPTEEAFAPIYDMQQRIMLAAVFLTLVAGALTWWMLRRQLLPLTDASRALVKFSDQSEPRQALPIVRNDEIGELIGGFNRLLETLGKREELLRQSEARNRAIAQSAHDAIITSDSEGKVVGWNHGAEAIFGYAESEVMGLSLTLLMPERYRDRHLAGMNRIASSAEHRVIDKPIELRGLRKDGSEFSLELSLANWETADGWFVTGIIRDITEHKRTEQVLATQKAQLLEAQRIAGIGSWEWALGSDIITWSEGLFLILGRAPASGAPGFTELPRFYTPQSWERLAAAIAKAIETGAPYALEIEMIRDNGTTCWTTTRGEAVSGPDGVVAQLRGTVHDITERMQAAKEKAVLEAQVQQAQKMDSVGRLAGGVAHDFNNMLTVIRGNVAMAIEQVDPAQPIHTDLVEIRKAADRSAELTRQLLAFARKQVVAPKVLNLNQTVEQITRMLQRLIGEDIVLKWLPEPNLWPVKVDPSQIDQILANLCINARDAIAGVGNIVIETGNSTFDEDYCATHAGFVSGQYARIAVSDDGHGMDADTLTHIFEPFFTTKGAGEGTGLGLATVYGAVKQNNGFINVYSEPDTGTTFTIYLPRYAGSAEREQTADATRTRVRGQETILVVEDEPSILKLTKRILDKLGYAVLLAKTPDEAMRLASTHADVIHLLVTDVVMPGMNGRELAKNLQSRNPGLKVLFMSGYTANIIVHQGVLNHGLRFIQKPFSIDGLAAKVREALDFA